MKVIVTGGAGFIGSHLSDELISNGSEVHILDNLTSGKRSNINTSAVFHNMDIRGEEAQQIIIEEKPDIVFHLAAQADVGKSILDPNYDASININGTINLLMGCIKAGVKKFIFASTSAVYGELQKEILSEKDITIPISNYGLSKLSAERYIQVFAKHYGLSYTILRYANVYGPRQIAKGEGGIVPVCIERIKAGQPIFIYGDGQQTRDFIFVNDVVKANIAAMYAGDQEIIQIGTSYGTSINDLLKVLEDIHGRKIEFYHREPKVGDIKHSCLNNHKAIKVLEWFPSYSLLKGLRETYVSEMAPK